MDEEAVQRPILVSEVHAEHPLEVVAVRVPRVVVREGVVAVRVLLLYGTCVFVMMKSRRCM